MLWQRSGAELEEGQREQLKELLNAFMDIFAARDEDCTKTDLVRHHIETGGAAPIRLRPHRLALAKRQIAEEKVREMAAAGIIEPSSSPWSAPAVLVQKKDGSWRFCVDYRRLNAVTKQDSYPLPRIDDALDCIAGSQWFSSLDLRSGYWQVALAPEAREKTAFTLGRGLWHFTVMPFGLCNAAATFERLMERVLSDVPRSRCIVYLDDLLVHASSFESALANLKEVFAAIRAAGLKLHPAKCNLLQRQVKFLGHVVDANGVSTDPDKVRQVRDWPAPENVSELQSFLGLASYYRRFVRGFADIAAPLHRLTAKGTPFEWTPECAAAFHRLREALASSPVLALPIPGRTFIVDTDASDQGIGAVLSQAGDGGERVVAFYSRRLSRPEKNYCVTRRELLAVVAGIKHFRPYLYGTRFLLRTDHASLTWLLNFKEPEGQIARWLELLQGYDFEVQHRPGRLHTNADALSRRPCSAGSCRHCVRLEERRATAEETCAVLAADAASDGGSTDDTELFRRAQEADPELAVVRGFLQSGQRPPWTAVAPHGPTVKSYCSQWDSLEVRGGLLYRRWEGPVPGQVLWQLLVPRSLKEDVLQRVHGPAGIGHFGVAKTLHRLRQRFHWAGCRQDVELFVHCCDACTARKGPSDRSHAPLQRLQSGAPMERVGVDVLGPFPRTDRGNRYVLVAMDYFTKWPEAYAVPDQSAATTAERLVEEMFCRFGAPENLHSDQGRNFESQVMKEVCDRLGVRKTRTTPLHPQSDGLVERFNRTLTTQLSVLTSRHQRDWDRHLPLVLWACRSAVQESTGCTPALLMFGRELRTPVDLAFGSPPEPEVGGEVGPEYLRQLRRRLESAHAFARRHLTEAGGRQKRAYDTQCRGCPLAPGDRVWVYNPRRKRGLCPKLTDSWVGPCVIL
uniref:Gypsy retrotransposon integrase-like protein 1 n=1 Tax=Scleropages formosus TaxID=113540 RepID=A0A8C9VS90_SCLFO